MSGGHYNYQYSRVRSLADDILQDVDKYKEEPDTLVPDDILDAMYRLARNLQALADAAHDIEWYMSGDYGDDTMRVCIDKWEKPL